MSLYLRPAHYMSFGLPLQPQRASLSSLFNDAGYFLYTLFLFTRSDIKTILIPTTVFGTMAAPREAAHLILPRLVWVWLNLLHFDVANQSLRPEEDQINKPWRPVPAMRISQRNARALRWMLVPACLALSWVYRVPSAGLVLTVANLCHNELKLDLHWATRNLCNAVGYACFNAGASRVLCDRSLRSSPGALYAQALNALLIFSTIHAQDFQDVDGDRASGRSTLPVLYPRISRLSMLLLLPAWSMLLSQFWQADGWASTAFVALGAYVGWRFYSTSSDRDRDHNSYRAYNLWLCGALALPFVYGWG